MSIEGMPTAGALPTAGVVLLHGDNLDLLERLPADSIDAVVTDPPYGLAFMGKEFDKLGDGPGQQAFHLRWARAVLRVLKPGGHLIAFGGTRTYHRLASGLEDAGFEMRDCLFWAYGCLSADSEALTRRGWVCGPDLRDTDDVLEWSAENGTFAWARPSRVVVAPYEGPMVRLVNRNTDQMLTPNHRVFARVRRHSRHAPSASFEVLDAAAVGSRSSAWQVKLPLAARLQEGAPVDPAYAYVVGWWLTDAWLHKDGKACMFSQSKPHTLAKLRAALAPHAPREYVRDRNPEKHAAEHTFYLTGPLADRLRADHGDRRLGWEVLGWSYAAREALFRGLMDGDGSQPEGQHAHTFWSKDSERRDVFLALAVSLGHRASVGQRDCVYVNVNTDTTEIQGKHKVPAEDYRGLVWCVTVPSGAFLARRNGKPFITGNSGFPKSLDVGKAIDKAGGDALAWRAFSVAYADAVAASSLSHADIDRALGIKSSSCYWGRVDHRGGMPPRQHWERVRALLALPAHFDGLYAEAEREVIGRCSRGLSPGSNTVWGSFSGDDRITAPATKAARQWDGWGTALKPAVEPAVLARKPLIGTVAANVMGWGTGALNVDGCRIPMQGEETNPSIARYASTQQRGNNGWDHVNRGARFDDAAAESAAKGRWPANLIHDGSPEVVGLFPAKAGASARASGPTLTDGNTSPSRGRFNGLDRPATFHADEGSAARFFYCAKAAPSERPDVMVCGCLAGVLPMRRDGPEAEQPCPTCGKPAKRLAHPTVKPVALMEYLIKLITPPGGVVLDPFAGSGSTLVAAQNLGVRAVGMEREAEYVVIARSRLEPA